MKTTTGGDRKNAVSRLGKNLTEENLWECIVAFAGQPFYTYSGLPFSYDLKTARDGSIRKELFIDRCRNSKSLSWSSIKIAFSKVLQDRKTVYERPKAIADVRGISYIYSIFHRFGIISVPEDVKERLKGPEGLLKGSV